MVSETRTRTHHASAKEKIPQHTHQTATLSHPSPFQCYRFQDPNVCALHTSMARPTRSQRNDNKRNKAQNPIKYRPTKYRPTDPPLSMCPRSFPASKKASQISHQAEQKQKQNGGNKLGTATLRCKPYLKPLLSGKPQGRRLLQQQSVRLSFVFYIGVVMCVDLSG